MIVLDKFETEHLHDIFEVERIPDLLSQLSFLDYQNEDFDHSEIKSVDSIVST